jgi:hypothetical protein
MFDTIYAQSKVVIAQPEYNILFANYNNIIECLSTEDDSISVETKNPTGVEILRKTDENSIQFFVVRPQGVPEITLDFFGYKNGKSHLIKSIVYQVRVYPKAEVSNLFLSKSKSNKIEMSYPTFFPISTSFTIYGGAIEYKGEKLVFSGDIAPASLISKINNGEKVILEVSYREMGKPNFITCVVVLPVQD